MYLQQAQDNTDKPWELVRWKCNRYDFISPRETPHLPYSARVSKLGVDLQHRTTSRGGDETLCIAILLGLDLEMLQQEHDACSVKRFW
jgi:hypothetical protein